MMFCGRYLWVNLKPCRIEFKKQIAGGKACGVFDCIGS